MPTEITLERGRERDTEAEVCKEASRFSQTKRIKNKKQRWEKSTKGEKHKQEAIMHSSLIFWFTHHSSSPKSIPHLFEFLMLYLIFFFVLILNVFSRRNQTMEGTDYYCNNGGVSRRAFFVREEEKMSLNTLPCCWSDSFRQYVFNLFLLLIKIRVVVLAEWLNLLVTHYHVTWYTLLSLSLILFLMYGFHTSFIKKTTLFCFLPKANLRTK